MQKYIMLWEHDDSVFICKWHEENHSYNKIGKMFSVVEAKALIEELILNEPIKAFIPRTTIGQTMVGDNKGILMNDGI